MWKFLTLAAVPIFAVVLGFGLVGLSTPTAKADTCPDYAWGAPVPCNPALPNSDTSFYRPPSGWPGVSRWQQYRIDVGAWRACTIHAAFDGTDPSLCGPRPSLLW